MSIAFGIQIPIRPSTLGKPSIGININPPTQAGPNAFLNRLRQCNRQRFSGYTDSTMAPFLDANGELTSLPAGVTSCDQLILAQSVTTSAEALAELTANLVGVDFIYKWTGGLDDNVSFAVGFNSTKLGPRRYRASFTGLGNRTITHTGLSAGNLYSNRVFVPEEHEALYDAGEIFTPEYIAHLTGFSVLRMLDTMETNTDETAFWTDRATPSVISQKPWCVEYLVEICNKTGASPWFTMPVKADEDYIRNFSTYVRDNLDSTLIPRWEWGNENWNTSLGFRFNYCRDEGRKYFGQNTDQEHKHYHGMRSTRMMRIISEVYGANRRYQGAMAWQNGSYDSDIITAGLWAAADPNEYTDPADAHDVLSCSTYFGNSLTNDTAIWPILRDSGQTAARDYMLGNAVGAVSDEITGYNSYALAAQSNNMRLEAYEGGQHISLVENRDNSLYLHIFTVPDGNAFTVGETATQETRTGTIVAKTATTITIDPTIQDDWSRDKLITSPSVPAGQTPTARNSSNPKDGVVDMLEAVNYGATMAGLLDDNRDNFFAAGGTLICEFNDIGVPSKFGSWPRRFGLSHNGTVWAGLKAWITGNPKKTAQRAAKVIPAPATRYSAYGISGLTETSTGVWNAKGGTTLTAAPTGLLGTETLSYSWRVNGVEQATGQTLALTVGGAFPDGATLTCVTTINGTPYTSRGVLIVA